jgi:aminodeoxychorismate synthase component I
LNRQDRHVVRYAHASLIAAIAPAEAFARLAARAGVFWLDSSLPRAGDGQFSMMSCEPRWVFTARDDGWQLRFRDGSVERGAAAALERLDALIAEHTATPVAHAAALPFCGGAVGWLSYDLGRQFELIDGTAQDDLRTADIRLAWHDAAIVWDHHENKTWLIGVDGVRSASAAAAELAAWLRDEPSDLESGGQPALREARSDLSRDDYLARVTAVQGGIARGEFYQLNLVQRFESAHHEPAAATYLRLRAMNPAPFAAFISTEDGAVLSSSPERFLTVEPNGEMCTCPIKGTRPRGDSPVADAALAAELRASEKERAELLMIVDLLRNDFGRVCVPGSVRVTRLHELETFATVHHLIGEVRGRLRAGVTRRELLRAVFPGGSITGAPKVSAMRAIDRLEPHRRGIAMGSLGYFSAHGRIDLNIAIRTIVCRDGRAYVAVGAGIVADSVPAAEYAETLAKGSALFRALGAQEVQT